MIGFKSVLTALKTLAVTAGANLPSALLGPKFILWLLRHAVTQTSNKVDDGCVDLLDSAYRNDEEGMKAAILKITDALKEKSDGDSNS